MSTIDVTDDEVMIRFTKLEKLAGLITDQAIPITAIDQAAVDPDPMATPRGLRSPGLALPGRTKIGTWRQRGRRQLVCLRHGQPAVRLDVHGERYGTYLVSTLDAPEVVDRVRRAIASARTAEDDR